MSQQERTELLRLKKQLTNYLDDLHTQIITFEADGNDDEFAFLVKKARNYRDVLTRIDQQLTDNEIQ